MNDAEKLLLYLVINAWNKKKCWTNFVALYKTGFDSNIWFTTRLYYIIRDTLNGKYERVCEYYRKHTLVEDVSLP